MKKTLCFLLVVFSAFLFSCRKTDDTGMKIGVLAGPTGMGFSKMMEDNSQNASYVFSPYASPDTAVSDFMAGDLDIVCLPTNTAAALYNKQNGEIVVLAVNCLCSLFVVADKSENIVSLSDLNGKTVYTSVPSSTTNPIVNFLFEYYGITVTVETEATHDALAAKLIDRSAKIAVFPEPKASSVLAQNDQLKVVFGLNSYWEAATGNALPMGCIIAKKDYVNNHEEKINTFLSAYQQSVSYISDTKNLDGASNACAQAGIIPKVALAKSALTNLDGMIVFHSGKIMKNELSAFYQILLNDAPTSIGGQLPEDGFYYAK